MRQAAQERAPAEESFLTASCKLDVLDDFRVPYQVGDPVEENFGQVRGRRGGPSLLWARNGPEPPTAATLCPQRSAAEISIFARIMPDWIGARLLTNGQRAWTPSDPIVDAGGQRIASIWQADDGSVFLPFDPDEVVRNYQSERYRTISTPRATRLLRNGARRAYYLARPAVPRSVQIWSRRQFTRIQERSEFPRWPVETSLHEFVDLTFRIVASIAGAPVPRLAAWPEGKSWALVLTHDVETAAGYSALEPVLTLERRLGLRSAWFYVPRRYEIDIDDLRHLAAEGLEVGVHGLYHDGRDLASLRLLRKRLPGMTAAAASWGATGFRAPALHRHWDWMPLLGFDYDSSYPDTDPYEPMAGGCCSWLPFFIGTVVELPVTLPQDHTLFVILGQSDETVWVQKTALLRDRGGMALVDTHPDYLVDEVIHRSYARFLEQYAEDQDAWQALPREVSAWWRRRAASHLERDGAGWRIVGPAADDGRVELIAGDG